MEDLPNEKIYEICEELDNVDLFKYIRSSRRIYETCKDILDKRKLIWIEEQREKQRVNRIKSLMEDRDVQFIYLYRENELGVDQLVLGDRHKFGYGLVVSQNLRPNNQLLQDPVIEESYKWIFSSVSNKVPTKRWYSDEEGIKYAVQSNLDINDFFKVLQVAESHGYKLKKLWRRSTGRLEDL